MMDPLRAVRIVNELKEKRLYSSEDISEFLSEREIADRNGMIELFKAMTTEFLFDWNYVQHHIMEVFDNDEAFLNLVLILAEQNYHESLSRLVGAYAINEQKTMGLYNRLLNTNSAPTAMPLTFLLLGIAKTDPDRFYDLIDLSDPRTAAKVAYVEALRIRSRESEIPDDIIPPIAELADASDDWMRRVAVNFLLNSRTGQEAVRNKLRQIASTGRKEEKIKIGREGVIRRKWDAKFVLELVTLCSYSDDIDVLNNLDMTMGSLAEDYPIECLDILKRWFRDPNVRREVSMGWAPEQIGKKDAERVDAYLTAWIADETDEYILRFSLPRLVNDIFRKHDRARLLGILGNIDTSSERGLQIFDEIAVKALSEMHGKTVDNSFVDGCHKLISNIATARGIDPSKVRLTKDDKILLALAILQNATAEKPQVDFAKALANLSEYKNIEQLIGRSWFEKKAREKDFTQPLIWILTRAKADESEIEGLIEDFKKYKDDPFRASTLLTLLRLKLEPHAFLEHIDSSIAIFMQDSQARLKAVRDGLTNPDQIYQTTGELFLAAHLRSGYPTEMQVRYGQKTADCKAVVDGTDIVVEVINLDMSLELKYLRTVVSQKGNRVKSKIMSDKLRDQIPGIAENTSAPIFLGINRGRSATDDIEIADALYGSLKMTLYFDKKTGQVVKQVPSREPDGISTTPAGRLISGVILYRTYYDFSDGKEKLEGEIFENDSDRPVGKELIEAIKKRIFNKALP
jgi:hypothetical protein